MTQLHAPRIEPDEQMQRLHDIMLAMVPFWVAELRLRNLSPENLACIASRAGKQFGHLGDQILFTSRASGQKLSLGAHALNALAEGIAAAELIEPGSAARTISLYGEANAVAQRALIISADADRVEAAHPQEAS